MLPRNTSHFFVVLFVCFTSGNLGILAVTDKISHEIAARVSPETSCMCDTHDIFDYCNRCDRCVYA